MLILSEISTGMSPSEWSMTSSGADAHLASALHPVHQTAEEWMFEEFCPICLWELIWVPVWFEESNVFDQYACRMHLGHVVLYVIDVRGYMQAMSCAEYLPMLVCRTLQLPYVGGNCYPWTGSLDQLRHEKDPGEFRCNSAVISRYLPQRCESKFCHCAWYLVHCDQFTGSQLMVTGSPRSPL